MYNLLFSWSGIKIAGGRSVLGADFGIFVKKVLSGGAADLDGERGDSSVLPKNMTQGQGLSLDLSVSNPTINNH